MTSASPDPQSPDPYERAVKPQRVRHRIFATACGLFQRDGIHEVCVDVIAKEAGSNKMTLYRDFGSKERLVAEH